MIFVLAVVKVEKCDVTAVRSLVPYTYLILMVFIFLICHSKVCEWLYLTHCKLHGCQFTINNQSEHDDQTNLINDAMPVSFDQSCFP